LAGDFQGNVRISGHLSKSSGGFKIDHPLDPANKYLYHSFVESPDMKNVYDGVVALDDKGEAVIDLPNWFGALNKDFRYQLTAIRAPPQIRICIFQRKYLTRLLLQTTVAVATVAIIMITMVTSRLQEAHQV